MYTLQSHRDRCATFCSALERVGGMPLGYFYGFLLGSFDLPVSESVSSATQTCSLARDCHYRCSARPNSQQMTFSTPLATPQATRLQSASAQTPGSNIDPFPRRDPTHLDARALTRLRCAMDSFSTAREMLRSARRTTSKAAPDPPPRRGPSVPALQVLDEVLRHGAKLAGRRARDVLHLRKVLPRLCNSVRGLVSPMRGPLGQGHSSGMAHAAARCPHAPDHHSKTPGSESALQPAKHAAMHLQLRCWVSHNQARCHGLRSAHAFTERIKYRTKPDWATGPCGSSIMGN